MQRPRLPSLTKESSSPAQNRGDNDGPSRSQICIRHSVRRDGRHRLRAGSHAAPGQRFPREPILREAHARLDRRRQQGWQGRPADQLHRRAEGDPDLRGRQGGADRRGGHRLQHRRLLHQRDARGGHPQALGDQRRGPAQERRLRPDQQDLGGEGQYALSRQGRRVHALPYLSQQEDRQARPHRTEDPHHAGVPRVLPVDERAGHDHRARRGLHRARARRDRRLRLADPRPLRPELAGEDEVPRRPGLLQRRGVADHEPGQVQVAGAGAARLPRPQGAGLRGAERFLEVLQPERGQAPGRCGHPGDRFRRGDEQGVRREGEGNRLGERHQGEPAIRPATAEGAREVVMDRLEAAYGKLLEAFALAACALVLGMTLMICADVLLRNARILPGVAGLEWSNEISEGALYLITMLTAPWLLRRGQHIRVDIILRAVPNRVGWSFEWVVDVLGLASCLFITYYGARAAIASFKAGSVSIKTLVTPEWWLLSVLPVAFLALSVEMLFRMRRLALAERAPRDDAVSTG